MKRFVVAFTTFVMLGCSIDSTAPVGGDHGGKAGSAGSGGKGGATTVGGAGSTPAGGAAGRGGSGGSVMGGSAGTGGSGGSSGAGGATGGGGADSDGSVDIDAGTLDVTQEPEAGFPEASTCAGYGLKLDGFSAYGTVTRMVQNDFTLEAWIKADGPSPAGVNFWNGSGIIYADTMNNNNDFGTSILNNHFTIGIGNPGFAEPTLQGLTDVTTGQWFHVAATRRQSTGELQVYVGAQLEASVVTTNHNPLTAPMVITLGADLIDSHYFSGVLDEVRIWNVVRSQSDIASTMHVRLAGNEPGLVGYWRFDEPGAATALDSSPTHADANLFGAVDWVPSDAPVCNAPPDAGPPDAPPDGVSTDAPLDVTAPTDAPASDAPDVSSDGASSPDVGIEDADAGESGDASIAGD